MAINLPDQSNKAPALRLALAAAVSLMLLLVVAYLDFITGYDFTFFVFYYLPIYIMAWYSGAPAAAVITLLDTVVWFYIDRLSGHAYAHAWFPYWNALVRWASFVVFAVALLQYKKERRLKEDLTRAMHRIRQYLAAVEKIAAGDLAGETPAFRPDHADQLDETFALLVRKIAEQKDLENRLNQLQRQAIVAETASYLAHEIRNPLNLIMLTAHQLGTQFAPAEAALRPKHAELIESLKSEVEHLNNMVSGFLAAGRPSELRPAAFAVADLMEQVQVLVKQQLTAKRIRLVAAGPTRARMVGDQEQLRLVFLNLLLNAIEASPAGGAIHWEAARETGSPPQTALSLTDDGPGIPAEHLEKIFDPYFSRKPGGTGLGLALVKRIVEEHGGSVRAANQPGRGARFIVTLPDPATAAP